MDERCLEYVYATEKAFVDSVKWRLKAMEAMAKAVVDMRKLIDMYKKEIDKIQKEANKGV